MHAAHDGGLFDVVPVVALLLRNAFDDFAPGLGKLCIVGVGGVLHGVGEDGVSQGFAVVTGVDAFLFPPARGRVASLA